MTPEIKATFDEETELLEQRAAELTNGAILRAQEIESRLDVEFITRALDSLPGEIRDQQAQVMDARERFEDEKAALGVAEAALALEVGDERNAAGKPAYSNAEARKAEVERRKVSSASYQATFDSYRNAERAYQDAQNDLALLEARFAAMRSLATITAERLRLIGGAR